MNPVCSLTEHKWSSWFFNRLTGKRYCFCMRYKCYEVKEDKENGRETATD